MFGAVAGDIIGSVYERHPIKTVEFPLFQAESRFTDDTVLSVATAFALMEKRGYAESFRSFGRRYPDAGYGQSFLRWLFESHCRPYGSWGNGAAMRVSPLGFALESVEEVLREAKKSAEVTHDHPEGIKGAQAAALAVFLASAGTDKPTLREEISGRFGYDLSRTTDQIRPAYGFEVSCQKSVPEAIIAFLDSTDYEDAVRRAVSLGGDSDTLACIAGAIAHAYYRKIPEKIVREVRLRLPEEFLGIIDRFEIYSKAEHRKNPPGGTATEKSFS